MQDFCCDMKRYICSPHTSSSHLFPRESRWRILQRVGEGDVKSASSILRDVFVAQCDGGNRVDSFRKKTEADHIIFYLQFPSFAVRLACFLHIKKFFDCKLALANNKKIQINTSLIKKKFFIFGYRRQSYNFAFILGIYYKNRYFYYDLNVNTCISYFM